jgi:hypothetical protein
MTQQMPSKLGELANKFRSLDMNDLETKQWEHGAGLIKTPCSILAENRWL